MFDRVRKELIENIEDVAPVAKIELGPTSTRDMRQTAGKLFVATLNGAQIGLDQPQLSPSTWTVPFTVISESVIAVTRAGPTRDGWIGRSHSLWFCDAKEENRFEWYELAFWAGAFGGRPAMEPFATAAASASMAFQPIMGTLALAWPVTKLDRSDLSEFTERWLRWFGDAASGNLQRPAMMPERPADGSWRRS